MSPGNDVILVGAFHEMVELCESCRKKIIGIVDSELKGTFMGYGVFGDDDCASELHNEWKTVPVVISPDTPERRKALAEYYGAMGFGFETLIHPDAHVSRSATIGKGVVIQARAHVSSAVVIRDFARINVLANLMHDVAIGAFATIAPNAVLLGHVNIGEMCYVGGNATLLPGVQVGKGAMIGAGATVTRNVKDRITVVGSAAREIDPAVKTRV